MARVSRITLTRVSYTPISRLARNAAAVEHPAVGVDTYGSFFRCLWGKLPELQSLSKEHYGAHDRCCTMKWRLG